MFDKLREIESRFEQIEVSFSIPEITGDADRFREMMKEHKKLLPIVQKFREYKKAKDTVEEALLLLESGDKELRELAEEELAEAQEIVASAEKELQILLLPRDPNDDKNVIVEIRGGAGGEESALFAYDLYRMYSMYAAACGWKTELLSLNETELGGFKEVSFSVYGESAYSKLKFESGVHRVQRVPQTESQGRIHTSTVTVAVLPEVEEVEVAINPADLIIETCKSSGAGGQHINKTESAIRIIHKPSGIVVECQEERSQFKNKDKAMKLLRARLYDIEKTKRDSEIADERRRQVGTGDRSERIRTYNFPQGRVTDHRIGLTLYTLDTFMNGRIDAVVDALISADTAEKLSRGETQNI
ncbi:MAG: peptide chain release factor 1 [Clostridia bacterium]|nr:peptide chain release factor 1 [Clostridia bacterium]